MSTTGMTFTEISESVTGFDEKAVEKHMGMDMYKEGEERPIWLLRSLVFVHLRHTGSKDDDARDVAIGMRLGDVNEYFDQADKDDDDDAEPDTETDSGKGEPEPEPEPDA